MDQLAQGNTHGVRFTGTIDFISKSDITLAQATTYASIVLDYRPLKSERNKVRITAGADKLYYAEDSGSPAANVLENKVLINSYISDAHKGAHFLSTDLKDYVLQTPMA